MKRIVSTTLIFLVLFFVLYLYGLPYYITEPGSTQTLNQLIKVDDGKEETGSFSLVTVSMSQANIIGYIWAKIDKYEHVYKEEEILGHDITDAEYDQIQLKYMADAKYGAIITAFNKAGKPVDIEYAGLYVYQAIKGMPAEKKLKTGDLIVKIDGQSLEKEQQYKEIFANKKAGDSVSLEIIRDGKIKTVNLKLAKLDTGQAGIGISLVEDKKVSTTPKVDIDSEDIGGPSAGLMFALEIYNQITDTDYTKGYTIAGTGTIDEQGNVGAIGGIDQKVVAADNDDAEIFFAPTDGGNYKEAVKTAKDIKTKMKVVPVKTFDDALAYLEKLEKK